MLECIENCFFSFPFRFESVPLVTPNGDVLIRELSFEVMVTDSLNTTDPRVSRLIFPFSSVEIFLFSFCFVIAFCDD